jgi:hypothetical protein
VWASPVVAVFESQAVRPRAASSAAAGNRFFKKAIKEPTRVDGGQNVNFAQKNNSKRG